MAGAGYMLFVAGQKLTAAQVNTYLMQQSVGQFATSSARDTALSAVLDEGLLSSQADSNSLTIYSGSAWSTIGPVHGALTSWTPTVTQSGSVTVTINHATYQRVGRMITAKAILTVTGSGTASNAVIIGGLPASGTTGQPCGLLRITDTSAVSSYVGMAFLASGTTVEGYGMIGGTASYNQMGTASGQFSAGLASTDVIHVMLSYEAAADA
jgi:hypothetical protein